jgi:hypothetical protein
LISIYKFIFDLKLMALEHYKKETKRDHWLFMAQMAE